MTTLQTDKLTTQFTTQFNIRYPVVLAPMFLVNTEKLVIAAAKAGIMGTFPAMNYRPINRYHEAIQRIKQESGSTFGINIIVQQSNKYQNEQIDGALSEQVALIITSLGNPKEVIRRAHETNTKVYCDVIGLEHAKKVADLGADGLIAVGCGAGGHAGTLSPFALIPHLVMHTQLPVLAAGSISDGKGLAAALSLGAAGAYMGTRFIASSEAEVDDSYKNAIIDAQPEQIIYTHKVDGFPGNFIHNAALDEVGIHPGFWETLVSQNKRFKRLIALTRAGKSLLGDSGKKTSYKTVYSAGHGVGLIDSVLSVDEIVQNIINEYRDIKQQLP